MINASRNRARVWVAAAALALVAPVTPALAGSVSEVYPGTTFKATDFRGGSVEIRVSKGKKGPTAEIEFSRIKTKCGRESLGFALGPVGDGSFSKRVSDSESPYEMETDAVKGSFAGDGRSARIPTAGRSASTSSTTARAGAPGSRT